jgi:hypothetical protein
MLPRLAVTIQRRSTSTPQGFSYRPIKETVRAYRSHSETTKLGQMVRNVNPEVEMESDAADA